MHKPCRLMLADGLLISGNCLYDGEEDVVGEVVFSTSTSGYSEILTDPSFYGQMVVLACPEVGNYGVNVNDFQSNGIKIAALIVRNSTSCTSSFRAHMTLADYLLRERIPIVYGVDTRAIIADLRDHGSRMAVFSTKTSLTNEELLKRAKAVPKLESERLSSMVSVHQPTSISLPSYDLLDRVNDPAARNAFHVVVMDFGIKHAIIRYLEMEGARITLMPSDSSVEEIWALNPDGLFLSNGPGDPQLETKAVNTVRNLLGKLPIFGVCMGHQIIAQALGGSTFKLKFGHRGSNQAVRRHQGGIITTAQNHGFAVTLMQDSKRVKFDLNIADGTNEGLDLPELNLFSVQFHPEGAPGPLDGLSYFAKFASMMEAWRKRRAVSVLGGDESNVRGF